MHYPRCQECEQNVEEAEKVSLGVKDTNHGGKRVLMLTYDDNGAI